MTRVGCRRNGRIHSRLGLPRRHTCRPGSPTTATPSHRHWMGARAAGTAAEEKLRDEKELAKPFCCSRWESTVGPAVDEAWVIGCTGSACCWTGSWSDWHRLRHHCCIGRPFGCQLGGRPADWHCVEAQATLPEAPLGPCRRRLAPWPGYCFLPEACSGSGQCTSGSSFAFALT